MVIYLERANVGDQATKTQTTLEILLYVQSGMMMITTTIRSLQTDVCSLVGG